MTLGPYAHAQHHQLSVQALSRFQQYADSVGGRFEGFGGLPQQQRHTVGQQLLDDGRRHFLVERRQYLVLQFDQGRFDAAPHQVFDQLQANKTRADHDRLPYSCCKSCDNPIGVLEIAQREDAGQVDAR